ncbi:MAG: envelope stress response membrane protein PspC [Chitinispirillaceae bacterium]|nr:envelope stress response membrane protein PspC [Chitinispirillaceae bacterium]
MRSRREWRRERREWLRERREQRRARHERMWEQFYRSRHGVALGVCRGIADHYDIPVFWVRVGVIILMVTTAVWPVVLAYFAVAFFLKPEPVLPFADESDNEFYSSFTTSRSMALHRLKKKFDQLQNRLRRMEDVVTSREYDWERKMGEG